MFRRLRNDDGQGLITVLFATMMILALVVAATTITASQAIPARQANDRAAALAAAEGGVQDFLARLAEQCASASCDLMDPDASGDGTIASSGSSFTWQVVSANATDRTVRI